MIIIDLQVRVAIKGELSEVIQNEQNEANKLFIDNELLNDNIQLGIKAAAEELKYDPDCSQFIVDVESYEKVME